MDKKTQNILEELRDSLNKAGFAVAGIYLFGSRSKDLHKHDSDYDVAIILKNSVNQATKDSIRSITYDIMLKHDVLIDSHIYTENDIVNPQTPFREVIRDEGIFYAG